MEPTCQSSQLLFSTLGSGLGARTDGREQLKLT